MKILYRGIFIATFKRTYIQDQARQIIVTSLLSYETSPYFSRREKSLLPKILSQLEPWKCDKMFWELERKENEEIKGQIRQQPDSGVHDTSTHCSRVYQVPTL